MILALSKRSITVKSWLVVEVGMDADISLVMDQIKTMNK